MYVTNNVTAKPVTFLHETNHGCTVVSYTCSCSTQGRIQGGAIGVISPPKTFESNFFTMILYNSENSIRDIRLFCRSLFCHTSVVK